MSYKKIKVGVKSLLEFFSAVAASKELGLGLEVVGITSKSSQNKQLVGITETTARALARAQTVFKEYPESIAIAIESGILMADLIPRVTIDLAVIVVLTKNQTIITCSPGIQFPEEYVIRAEKTGFQKTTIGSIIENEVDCYWYADDPHIILTADKISRSSLLTQGIKLALKQINKEDL